MWKGKIANLLQTKLKLVWLAIASFLLEAVSQRMLGTGYKQTIIDNTLYINIIVYVLLFVFVIINIKEKGFKFVFIGSLMNATVIFANKGFMPVSHSLAEKLGYEKSIEGLKSLSVFGHKILEIGIDKVIFLADVINIPPPYPMPRTISIGDIVLSIGVFLFIYLNMTMKEVKHKCS